jgi:hypothetical protein
MIHYCLELHVQFCSTQLPCTTLLQLLVWQHMLWLKSLSTTFQSCSTGWPAFQETNFQHQDVTLSGCTDQQQTPDRPLDLSPQMLAFKLP